MHGRICQTSEKKCERCRFEQRPTSITSSLPKPEPKKVPHHVDGAPHTQNMRVNDLYDDTLRQLQPETGRLLSLRKTSQFNFGALDYHEGGVDTDYPWDGNLDGATKYSRAPDDNIFKHAASIYAQSHGKMKLSKEFVGGITNERGEYPLWGGITRLALRQDAKL